MPCKYLAFTVAICCCTTALGQSSGSTSKAGSAGQNAEEPAPSSLGFSIETEMFTYKAVTENSRVLACDVARYLYGSDIDSPPEEAHYPCNVKNGTVGGAGIVIISPTSSLLDDFQLWRADMETMGELQDRATKICTPVPQVPIVEPKGAGGKETAAAASGLLDLTPAGQAFSLFQGALGMLAKNQSVTSVAGTVRDQALMNEVARQLRSLNISVLIPETYGPYALGIADYKSSPYLRRLEALYDARQACETAKNEHPAPAQAAQVDSVISSIEAFLNLGGPSVTSQVGRSGESPDGSNQKQPPPSQPPASAASHFARVFAADGVARRMGFSGEYGQGPNATW